MVDDLPHQFEEFFNKNSKKSDFVDLFEATEDNIDLRTDLSAMEINYVNIIQLQSDMALKYNIKRGVLFRFINGYKRLKVSLDRKSRDEFVIINKKEHFDEHLNKFNAFKNLQDTKKY